jgi:hypothetical protein
MRERREFLFLLVIYIFVDMLNRGLIARGCW